MKTNIITSTIMPLVFLLSSSIAHSGSIMITDCNQCDLAGQHIDSGDYKGISMSYSDLGGAKFSDVVFEKSNFNINFGNYIRTGFTFPYLPSRLLHETYSRGLRPPHHRHGRGINRGHRRAARPGAQRAQLPRDGRRHRLPGASDQPAPLAAGGGRHEQDR